MSETKVSGLSDDAKRRFVRHTVLPQIGEAGQLRLAKASALVIGAGGLGSQAAAFLAAMGVGRIGIVDDDRVELSNLQRQILYETGDIGRRKTEAAKDALEELNPDVVVECHATRIDEANAEELVRQCDIVLDGSDNFPTRFAVHDACYHAGRTLVSAAISGFEMQLSTFKAHQGDPHPCYRCFVPAEPEYAKDCRQEGIIGALAGMAGAQQALEAVKELLGIGDSLSGYVYLYDALAAKGRKVLLHREETCALCGNSSRHSSALPSH